MLVAPRWRRSDASRLAAAGRFAAGGMTGDPSARCDAPRCTTGTSRSAPSSPTSAAGRCRSSTPAAVSSRSTPPCARRSASSTSATSARPSSAGPGAAAYVNACLTNDLGRIAPGPGAVHAVLRRRDRWRRRRPDRLPARRRRGLPGPERRQHRRGRTPAGGRRRRTASTVDRPARGATRVLAVQGPRSDEVLERARAADRPRLHVVRRRPTATVRRSSVCRTGYTGERGYELVRAGDAAGALWDALLAAGEPHGHAGRAGSAPATRCAPRWATRCTGRTSRLDDHAGAGPARLGGRLEEAGRSGAGRRCSPRRRPARRGPARPRRARPRASRGRTCR